MLRKINLMLNGCKNNYFWPFHDGRSITWKLIIHSNLFCRACTKFEILKMATNYKTTEQLIQVQTRYGVPFTIRRWAEGRWVSCALGGCIYLGSSHTLNISMLMKMRKTELPAGSHWLIFACIIFCAANVKLGVLFNSHHMFSPFPHLLHCELLCSLILSW